MKENYPSPLPSAPEPDFFSCPVGDREVILLVDKRYKRDGSIFIGMDEAKLQRYLPEGIYQSEANAFLVRGGASTFLIDTGYGHSLFEILAALQAAPEQVDGILLTHLHPDHTGGLQRDGKALFPRARVYLSRQEMDFWSGKPPAEPLLPYEGRIETFSPGELGDPLRELLPGISPIAAFGHTPGHTLFMVHSREQELLIFADVIHAGEIQLPLPEIPVTFDKDPAAAIRVREKVLAYVADRGLMVAGSHLVYPAVGHIARLDGRGYRFSFKS